MNNHRMLLLWKKILNYHQLSLALNTNYLFQAITKKIAEETNLYSVQKTGTSINTTEKEIEQFPGIQMKTATIHMPNFELYWTNGTRYKPFASAIPSKRCTAQKKMFSIKNFFRKLRIWSHLLKKCKTSFFL